MGDARGVVGRRHGSALLLIFSFLMFTLATVLPLWAVERREGEEVQTWIGDGLFRVGVAFPWMENGEARGAFESCEERDDCGRAYAAAAFSLLALVLLLIGGPLKIFRLVAMSGVSMATTCGLALWSPRLTKDGHDDLNLPGVPLRGIASCSFNTPFHSISALFQSADLVCVFPGPSYVMASTALGSLALALVLMYGVTTRKDAAHDEGEDEGEELSKLSTKRSLYESVSSALNGSVVASAAPLLLFVAHATCWLVFCMTGIEIISGLIVYNRADDTRLWSDVLTVFNFSPITSTEFFWHSGARLVCVLMFASVGLLPWMKLAAWILLYFKPVETKLRFYVLALADWIGKFQLANIYLLAFLGASLSFHRHIEISSSSKQYATVGTGLTTGDNLGSVMYFCTFISSLFIGQLMLWLHASAEEAKLVYHDELEGHPLPSLSECVLRHVDRNGIAYTSTRLSRAFIWLVWVMAVVGVLAVQHVELVSIHRPGVIGRVVMKDGEYTTHTLWSLGLDALHMTWIGQSYEMPVFFVMATLVGPMIRLVWLGYMMRTRRSSRASTRFAIRLDSIFGSWSGLDVFFVSTLVMRLQIHNLTTHLMGDAIPHATTLLRLILPYSLGDLSASMRFRGPGISLLVMTLVCEKLVAYLIVETAVADSLPLEKEQDDYLYFSLVRAAVPESYAIAGLPRSSKFWKLLRALRLVEEHSIMTELESA